jgi:adenine-specific DNA-methyltransferase
VQVIKGERGGISQSTGWTEGGGFNFCTLSSPAFLETGLISPEISFEDLASFIWHFETKLPSTGDLKTPLLGIHEGTAYYLLYNGILGDRKPSGGNVLTKDVLKDINKIYPHAGSKVIYGETTRLGPSRLDAENITFKQIPYDINVI